MSDLYCYFGSRYFGTNSVLDIFYKYNVVFAGMKNADKYKDEFKAGTKIAICEGKKVKAIGIAIADFNTLDNLDINFLDEEKKLFEIEEWVLAVKVKIFRLEEKDYFEYDAIVSGFSPINTREDIKDRIDELIKKYSGEKMKEEIINILQNKKQIILQGAPGTGKTYSSSELAVKLIDENAPSDRAELMKRYKELVDKEQIFFTTFHQSMDYEEFVEGIKPNTVKDNIIYKLNDGIFKKACKTAENKSNKVVLIIDEINRGNISKIFGELITLLETDKRKGKENEIEAILPYSKEKFSVPDNLYIIGTMNTADRSIGYVDYALRRRFAFITIRAEEDKIKNYYDNKDYDCGEKAKILFGKIAKLIKENINEEFDADDIMVGHSYFMAQNLEELQNKLEYEIKPLLLEYLKDGILKLNDEIKDKVNKLNINNLEL